jgi:hypothetical protein
MADQAVNFACLATYACSSLSARIRTNDIEPAKINFEIKKAEASLTSCTPAQTIPAT